MQIDDSIVSCIKVQAETRPQHIALVVGRTESTYGELWAQIKNAAAWYRDHGIQGGDRILLSTDSRDPFCVAAYFGAHLAGGVVVPMSFRASPEEIQQRAEFVATKFAVFDDRLASLREVLMNPATVSDSDHNVVMPRPTDIAEIMFTTGSSGEPKGVTLSHGNIAASARLIMGFVGNTSDDREVVTVPLTHSFGLGRLRSIVLAGGTMILVPGLTFPQLVMRALDEHSASGLACVPAGMMLLMSKHADGLSKLSKQLRYLEMGSMRFSVQEKRRLSDLLPDTRLCMHYGLTEASRSTFLEFHKDRDSLDSVGQPSPGVEISINDEDGEPVPNGKVGLITVRAKTVMQGYWNNDLRTQAVLDRTSGWLRTDDLGYMDADNYVYYVGRSDDVINCGGVKIIPEDVEKIAASFSGVDDCGCVGVPDPDGILGEVPVLFVRTSNEALDISELSRFVRGRLDSEISTIVVRELAKLPRSPSGKLLRRELCKEFDSDQSDVE